MERQFRKRMQSSKSTEVEPKESDETKLIEGTKRRELKWHMCRLCLACKLSCIGWVILAYYVCVEKWFCKEFQNPSFEFNVTMLTLNSVCVVFGAAYFCSIVLYIIEKRRHNQDKFKNQIDQEIRLSEYQTELDQLKEELRMKDDALKRELLELEQRIEEEKVARQKAETRFDLERIEKEKVLTRLSAYAGEKLRLNNPGLADLSDENRPNKLAEKFSELYDNAWTDALESLADMNQTEESQIQYLLQTLRVIYDCCMEFSERQRTRLILDVTKPSTLKDKTHETDVPGRILSKVIDLQKQTASDAIADMTNYTLNEIIISACDTSMQKYIDCCIEYCWMMAIQDPPMKLDFGPAQNEKFDKEVFRCYTITGEKVQFMVWPAVFLHKNGPLVTKGVLQPTAK